MASALTPAQKAALTKQAKKTAAKQGEQIVEGGAALLTLAHKSTADAIAEMLKQKEYGFCLLLKELIANGSLEQVLMANEEGKAAEKVLYIRQGCVRWRALPVKYQEMLLNALAPAVLLWVQQVLDGAEGPDMLEILMHALHVGPESFLPHRWCKEAVAVPVLIELCKQRHEQMGRRLDDVGQSGCSFKYWSLQGSPCRLVFANKENMLEIPLPFEEMPADAEVIDDMRMSAKLRVKSKLIEKSCLELARESAGAEHSALQVYLIDEEAEWKVAKASECEQPAMSETPAASSKSDTHTSGAGKSSIKRARPTVAEPAVSRKKSFSSDVFAALQGDGSSRSTKR
eukprot:4476362-Amphidinium_carterae.2